MTHFPLIVIKGRYGVSVTRTYPQPTYRKIGREAAIREVLDEAENNVPIAENAHLSTRHHWAFVDWAEGIATGAIRPGGILLHLDEHSDLHSPAVDVPLELQGELSPARAVALASGYILELNEEDRCPQSSYVVPAAFLGWFNEMYRVVPDGEYRQEDVYYEVQRQSGQAGPSAGLCYVNKPKAGAEIVTLRTHVVPIDLFPQIFRNPEGRTVTGNIDCDFWNYLLKGKRTGEVDVSAAILESMRRLSAKVFDVARPGFHTIVTEPGYCSIPREHYPLLIKEYLRANGCI